ncbi:hypothetical protein [Variovorax rhizosphaerae]|uniref:Uncharacterized protein n=1 Tax=Variovorax rhizosphaerae TaxID=1836200 RepID=A0ABU8WDN3_9BURK
MDNNLDQMRLQLERDKATWERNARKDEFLLREKEFEDRRENDRFGRRFLSSPLTTATVVAAFGLLGTALAQWLKVISTASSSAIGSNSQRTWIDRSNDQN